MCQNTPERQRSPRNLKSTFQDLQERLRSPFNVIWQLWKFTSLSEQLRKHRNVLDCLSTPQNVGECLKHPGTCQNHENVSECLRKFCYIKSTSKSFEIPLELFRTDENASKHFRMLNDIFKAKRTIENRSEPMRMPQNALETLKTPKNIRENLRTLRIFLEPLGTHENSSECHQTTSEYSSGPSATIQNCWESMRMPQITFENL